MYLWLLKGEPPGYDKAFSADSEHDHEDKPKDLLQKQESQVRSSYSDGDGKKDGSGEEVEAEVTSKEDTSKSAEETNSSREAANNNNSGEEESKEESKETAQSSQNEKKNSEESKNEEQPFERYWSNL